MTRLSSKLFLANSVSIVALAAVAIWSLFAIDQLVSVTRSLSEDAAPAIRHEVSLLRRMQDMVSFEKKYGVLRGDPGYLRAWGNRADGFHSELRLLGERRLSQPERAALGEVERSFDEYVDAFGTERSKAAADDAMRSLKALEDRTYDSLERAKQESARLEHRTWNAVLLAWVGGVLAALLSSGWLAVRLTRDLRRLSGAASQVAEGTFTGALPVLRRDEIGEVALAFRSMAERLREIDRSKEEFFAQVSHEFRSPLTAVREATSLLRDRVAGPIEPKQERLLAIIEASCERLLRLVDRILTISRLRARLQTIEWMPVDLRPVMRHALDELRPQAEARGLHLEGVSEGQRMVVEGDEDQLLEIFVNLVGNAIKYSSEGGAVRVRLASANHAIEISVQDTGVGIAPDALPHIFDRYWQAPGARDGSGLGLAIVKSIVEAHGGTVRGDSQPGQGTRFTVRLPTRGAP